MPRLYCFAFLAFLLTPSTSALAAVTDAPALLPSTVAIYVETSSSGQLLNTVLDHPQRQKFEALPQYQAWLESDDYRQLTIGVKFVESQVGTTWREALELIGAGGIHFALDGATQSVALLIQSDDAAFLTKVQDTLVNLSLLGVSPSGGGNPLREVDYRGIEAYAAEKARIAVFDKWLIFTNSSQLGKGILDRLLDGPHDSLAENQRFQAAVATRPHNGYAWAYANVDLIRSAGVAEQLLGGKANNPAAELLVGGVLNTLNNTPFATAHLVPNSGSVELAVKMPHDDAWTPLQREFFFGPEHSGTAPPEIALPDTILEVRAHRGFSGMWLHGPDLFDEEINARLTKANSNLTTVFGGRPFAEEILGALDGRLRLVVVQDDSPRNELAKSSVKLPGFAAIASLTDPDKTQRPLRNAFQTAIGLGNLIGAQQGRPPLEMDIDRTAGRTILTASYHPDDLADEAHREMASSGAGSLMSLSPTIGFVDDKVVVASTQDLASKLLDRLAQDDYRREASRSGAAVTNSALRLQAAPLRHALAENRERLIANNMLEKGHDHAAASQEIDGLLTVLSFFEQGDASLQVDDDELALSIRLTLARE